MITSKGTDTLLSDGQTPLTDNFPLDTIDEGSPKTTTFSFIEGDMPIEAKMGGNKVSCRYSFYQGKELISTKRMPEAKIQASGTPNYFVSAVSLVSGNTRETLKTVTCSSKANVCTRGYASTIRVAFKLLKTDSGIEFVAPVIHTFDPSAESEGIPKDGLPPDVKLPLPLAQSQEYHISKMEAGEDREGNHQDVKTTLTLKKLKA